MKFAIHSSPSESPPPASLVYGGPDAARGIVPLASTGGLFHASAAIFEPLDRLRRMGGGESA